MGSYTVDLKIEVDGEAVRTVALRKPMPYRAAQIVSWLTRTQKDSTAYAESADLNSADQVLQLHQYRAAMQGYLIGKCLQDPPEVSGETPELWGVAVVESLIDQGWTEEEIGAAFDGAYQLCCVSALSIPDMSKVNATLDFGEARTE